MKAPKPIQYHLEIYRESLGSDPIAAYQASTPFQAVAVGDTFDHRVFEGLSNPPGAGEALQVKAVRHIVWDILDTHVGHKVMVVLEKVRE